MESGGAPVDAAREFRVHRQLPSGRLSACRLVLAPDGRLLLGVEVPGIMPGERAREEGSNPSMDQ